MTSFSIILQLLCFLSDFAQIFHRDAFWYNKKKQIFLRLTEKCRHNDVITDFDFDFDLSKVPVKECVTMAI